MDIALCMEGAALSSRGQGYGVQLSPTSAKNFKKGSKAIVLSFPINLHCDLGQLLEASTNLAHLSAKNDCERTTLRMTISSTLSYGYGALLIIGGLIGAAKGSVASLVASGASAAVILGLEQFVSHKTFGGPAGAFQLVTSLVLTIVMYNRWDKSGKFMPAGLVTILSAVLSAVYGARLANMSAAVAAQKIKH